MITNKKSKIEKQTTFQLPGTECEIRYIKQLPPEIRMTKEEFEELWKIRPEKPTKVIVANKEWDTPRLSQTFGKDYNYSGVNHKAKDITNPYILKILGWVKKDSGVDYNGVMVNWYRDGKDCIGEHSDDETGLEDEPIYSFSFGATRDFYFKSKKSYEISYRISISLQDNSLVIMGSGTQDVSKHGVPKTTKEVKDPRRINITFRKFKEIKFPNVNRSK